MSGITHLVGLALVLTAAVTTATHAQMSGMPAACGPTADIKQMLWDKYGEVVIVQGENLGTQDEETVKIYANMETGTFTIAIESLKGELTCSVGAGEKLRLVDPVPPTTEDPGA